MDNPHASQFEFRPSSGMFVQLWELHTGAEDRLLWTGHYARQGRPILEGLPTHPADPDPHMQQIADKLNAAVEGLNQALRTV